jgi:ubiquinone biosynthesis accessory factor UbiJ
MLGKLNASVHAALAPRGLLVLNHLLLAEPAAQARLRAHVGKTFELQVAGVPAWAGPLPPVRLCVTPAGLLELAQGSDAVGAAPIDLVLTVQAVAPWVMASEALNGRSPEVDVAGDAALATELNWLAKNVRWDIADDLQRLVGPGPAQAAAQTAAKVVHGAAGMARALMKAMPGNGP